MDNIVVTICSSEGLLSDLANESNAAGIEIGPVRPAPPPLELKLDPSHVASVGYQVLGVISTVGGVVTFIDWILAKVKAARVGGSPADVGVSAAGKDVMVSTKNTDAENRALLTVMLQPSGEISQGAENA